MCTDNCIHRLLPFIHNFYCYQRLINFLRASMDFDISYGLVNNFLLETNWKSFRKHFKEFESLYGLIKTACNALSVRAQSKAIEGYSTLQISDVFVLCLPFSSIKKTREEKHEKNVEKTNKRSLFIESFQIIKHSFISTKEREKHFSGRACDRLFIFDGEETKRVRKSTRLLSYFHKI